MKIYAVIESYQDYKVADATLWGVSKTREKALARLKEAIEERYEYIREDKEDDEWEQFIGAGFVNEDMWGYDDGDTVTRFYIETAELEED